MSPDITLRDSWLVSDDVTLSGECTLDFHRASGHGGQHINKTDSAVRVTHRPSGVIALSQESRNQHENRKHALDRLRRKIAMTVRCEPDGSFRLPAVLPSVENGKTYPLFAAHLLDLFVDSGCSLKPMAVMLEISSSRLLKIFHRDPELWQQISRLRAEAGLSMLRFHS